MANKTTQPPPQPKKLLIGNLRKYGIILPDGSVEMGRADWSYRQNLTERFIPALAGAQ